MTDVIVLGWDGLDIELMREFGLGEAFGTHRARIDTHVNPVIDEPHTRELWPSMITGVSPSEHGIRAVTETDGVDWDNPLLDLAAPAARKTLPKDWVTALGARLRDSGFARPDTVGAEHYEREGVSTVFDAVGGRSISIPNYRTVADERHGFDEHRSELWKSLEVTRDGTGVVDPEVAVPQVYRELGERVGARLGLTVEAVTAGEPLVWTWFGVLDSAGHLGPAVETDLVADWYETAAAVTAHTRAVAPPDATVVAISDHGIQAGDHTHYATVASDDPEPVEDISHVFEVSDWVRGAVDSERVERGIDAEARESVQEKLDALGYT